MKWLSEIFSGTMGATAALTIRELIASLGKKSHEIVVEKINDLIKNNPRAELLEVLLTLDEQEAKNFWDNYDQKASDEGFEDTFIKVFAEPLKTICKNKDGETDLAKAHKIYTQILQMGPECFWKVYEELKHDPIAQRVKHWQHHGASFAEAILEGLAYGAGVAVRTANKLNQRAAQADVEINNWRVQSEMCGKKRIVHRGQPRRTPWTWFCSKHRGLI
jgi:hypothetical protein